MMRREKWYFMTKKLKRRNKLKENVLEIPETHARLPRTCENVTRRIKSNTKHSKQYE